MPLSGQFVNPAPTRGESDREVMADLTP